MSTAHDVPMRVTGLAPRVQIRQYVTMEHLCTARHAAGYAVNENHSSNPTSPTPSIARWR